MKLFFSFLILMSLIACGKKTEESSGVKISGNFKLKTVACFVDVNDVEASQAYTMASNVDINIRFKGRNVTYTANTGDCVTNASGKFKISKRFGGSGAIIDMEMNSCGNGCELTTTADAAPNESVDIPMDVTSSTAQDIDLTISNGELVMRAPTGFTGSANDISSECGNDCECYFVFNKN